MTIIRFCDEQSGQILDFPEVQQSLPCISEWAERNNFNQVVFWRDDEKFWVELDGHKLHYWMPKQVFVSGSREEIEMQLDYARGAQRREAVGYDKFDR